MAPRQNTVTLYGQFRIGHDMINTKAGKSPGIGVTQAPAFGHIAVVETLPCQADRKGMWEVVKVTQQDHPVR